MHERYRVLEIVTPQIFSNSPCFSVCMNVESVRNGQDFGIISQNAVSDDDLAFPQFFFSKVHYGIFGKKLKKNMFLLTGVLCLDKRIQLVIILTKRTNSP